MAVGGGGSSLVGCGLSKTPLSLGWAVFQKHLLLGQPLGFHGFGRGHLLPSCRSDTKGGESRSALHWDGCQKRKVGRMGFLSWLHPRNA